MWWQVFRIVLGVAVAAVTALLAGRAWGFRLPGVQTGYEPAQPIAYSHRLHAGELQMPCLYCHHNAETSRHAGIPSANLCLNCHKEVTAPFGSVRAEDELAAKEQRPPRTIISPELRKLYDALALDDARQPKPGQAARAIAWSRVYRLPDYVYFDHRAHVNANVTCQTCHGPVETMERMRQVPDLTMGWCVNCHRQVNQTGVEGKRVNASLDCSACHF